MTRTLGLLAALIGIVLLVPSLCAAGNSSDQPGQVDLRPRYLPGQVIRYVLDTSTRGEVKCDEVPEMSGKQTIDQSIGLALKVIEAGSDGATLELVYETVKVKFDSENGSAEYDSAAPPKPPAGNKPVDPMADPDLGKVLESLVKGMAGAKLGIKTDAAGNVVSVTGDSGISGAASSFTQAMGQGVPGLSGALPSASDTAKWLIGGTRSTGMARIGETWTNEDTLAGTPVGSFTMKTSHTLRSHAGGIAKVAFTGRAEAASAAAAPSVLGFQLKGCTHDGSYEWDTARGMLAKMDADMRVSIEGAMTGVTLKHESVTTMKVRRTEELRPTTRPNR